MQETILRFQSLKDLISFKQQTMIQDLRIDTAERSLTGRFPENDLNTAVTVFKASIFSR